MEKISFQKLKKLLPSLKRNISLAKHTTFKIGGKSKYFLVARKKEDLIKAIKVAKEAKLPFFILGGGSNVLVSDKGCKGLVIKFQISNFKFQNDEIYAEAGTELWKLVELSIKKSLTGLEWSAGIPGTVGGAICGNASAFGGQMAQVIKRIEVLDTNNLKIKTILKKDYKPKYKDTIFKNKKNLIILSAIFQLKKGSKKEIKEKINEYLNYRKKHHPLDFPSAGSVFKNHESRIKNQELIKEYPELKEFNKKGEIPAGYLIERCSLKGKKIGRAQISKKHANFIINLNEARAKDVLKLIKLIKKKVKNKFGIILEEEIQYLGF